MTKTQAANCENKNKIRNHEAPRQKIVSSKASKLGKRMPADSDDEEIK